MRLRAATPSFVLGRHVGMAWIRLGVYACFFLSGATSMVFEVLWSRQFVTVFGNSSYAISIVLWAGALNLVEVNYAYPFLALGFLANALMSRAILGESIPPMRWAALAFIILGVSLQAFTGAPKHL